MPNWIWEHRNWPNFVWDNAQIIDLLGDARRVQGKLQGIVDTFTSSTREQMNQYALVEEMVTTSAIEGEAINRDSVRSSIANRLGIYQAGMDKPVDRYVEGLLDMLLDATMQYAEPLTTERLLGWHAALFPTGYSGIHKISVGQYRSEGAMQVISYKGNKPIIHFQAPPHTQVLEEMDAFLAWFNADVEYDNLIKAAIAHLWFETLHPLDDGNGRVGRALIEMILAKDENSSLRFYSLSSQIMRQRRHYYAALGQATTGDLDITAWLQWFLQCFTEAINTSLDTIENIKQKNLFWQHHAETQLNARQCKVLNKLLDIGQEGFTGGMTTKKYMHITRTSRATAYRELNDLVNKSCLEPIPGQSGRSTAYRLLLVES